MNATNDPKTTQSFARCFFLEFTLLKKGRISETLEDEGSWRPHHTPYHVDMGAGGIAN